MDFPTLKFVVKSIERKFSDHDKFLSSISRKKARSSIKHGSRMIRGECKWIVSVMHSGISAEKAEVMAEKRLKRFGSMEKVSKDTMLRSLELILTSRGRDVAVHAITYLAELVLFLRREAVALQCYEDEKMAVWRDTEVLIGVMKSTFTIDFTEHATIKASSFNERLEIEGISRWGFYMVGHASECQFPEQCTHFHADP